MTWEAPPPVRAAADDLCETPRAEVCDGSPHRVHAARLSREHLADLRVYLVNAGLVARLDFYHAARRGWTARRLPQSQEELDFPCATRARASESPLQVLSDSYTLRQMARENAHALTPCFRSCVLHLHQLEGRRRGTRGFSVAARRSRRRKRAVPQEGSEDFIHV